LFLNLAFRQSIFSQSLFPAIDIFLGPDSCQSATVSISLFRNQFLYRSRLWKITENAFFFAPASRSIALPYDIVPYSIPPDTAESFKISMFLRQKAFEKVTAYMNHSVSHLKSSVRIVSSAVFIHFPITFSSIS